MTSLISTDNGDGSNETIPSTNVTSATVGELVNAKNEYRVGLLLSLYVSFSLSLSLSHPLSCRC